MVKKCIVKYDDLEKPIEIVELKEFSDSKVLSDFREQCLVNKKDYLKRLKEKAENELKEKEKVANDIKSLREENESLKKVISHILGYEELEEDELKQVLGVEEHEEK